MEKSEIVKKYLKKYSSLNSTQIAKKIYESDKELFQCVEKTRSLVRYYRGKKGKHDFKHLATAEFIQENKDVMKKIPNVLLFDIETSPMVGYMWGVWKQNIPHGQILKSWHLISWAAKWLYESETHSECMTIEEMKKGDDSRITKSLLKMFNDADIIIAHNLKKFDDKRAKTRFLMNGFNPPTPYQMIDTLEQSRKEFAHPSNRLDYLGRLFNDHGKIDTDFELWDKCMNLELNGIKRFTDSDQQEALDYMLKYNIEDVFILEEYYLEIRAWIKNHPNMGIYQESTEMVCYKCGSPDLKPDGEYVTPLNRYQAMRCNHCGAIGGRERVTSLNKKQKDALISPVAR